MKGTVQNSLSLSKTQTYADKIDDYLDKIKKRGQGFYDVIDDKEVIESILKYYDSVRWRFQTIVILGIGGSALGTICLNSALGGVYSPAKGKPRLYVLDNIDPVLLSEFEHKVEFKKTLFIVVTKSGGTPETMAQFLYFKKKIEEAKLHLEEHFVFITDPKKGLLRKLANENPKIQTFDVPENVGGRFSVLTAVGLLPAALLGYDILKLLDGARKGRDKFMNEKWTENSAFQLAVTQFLLYQQGINMTVTFPYAQKLIRLSDWYRQLLAESIGKAVNDKGEKVNVGITPIHALGVTDQHSQNQLYNEGPNDKFFIFMNVKKPAVDLEIPFDEAFQEELGYLKGVSFNKLLQTEMQGTMSALLQAGKPCVLLTLDQLNEESLGELFLLLEGSIAFLGELFEINAYDQPGVELSKKLTKELLSK